MSHFRIAAATAAIFVSVSIGGTAGAQSVAEFYAGKTITITAATGAGSAYGVHGRILAETMQKYIPGNPNIIMQFMPGGGGSKMANYMYNVAPRDGTQIGFPLKYIAVNQALGRKGLKYDAAKFNYIGSLGPINSVVAMLKEKSPVASFEEAKKTEAVMASTGKSSETFITPTLIELATKPADKAVLSFFGNGNAVGWLFLTPPEVPADRIAALRAAFDKSMKDPAYLAAVAERKLDVKPVSGEQVTKLINETLAVTPAQLTGIRAAMDLK